MDRKLGILVASTIGAAFLTAGAARGEEKGVDWKTLQGAKVSLKKGLAAAQQKGKPISAKFEMDEGQAPRLALLRRWTASETRNATPTTASMETLPERRRRISTAHRINEFNPMRAVIHGRIAK